MGRWIIWTGLSLLATVCSLGCRQEGDVPGANRAPNPASTPEPSKAELFTDVAAESGLHFNHFIGATGEYYFPEMNGAGCALIDFDNDGDLDVYAVQGALLGEGKTREDLTFPLAGEWPARNALFRNDLTVDSEGRRVLRFTDVTKSAGVGHTGYGQGCVIGDYNNDGYTDLYLTNFGSNVLYRNRGDGTFEDVTESAGVDDGRWSTSGAFLDYDRDGDLDLFVVNYVDFHLEENLRCFGLSTEREYCGPSSFPPVRDRLYRNNGDGTFDDVTDESGIQAAFGAGLGVCLGDFDNDNWIDIYVANDGNANQLWMNQKDGTFRDTALISGTALNAEGMPEAGMGVASADFDLDGDEDIFVTHLREETNTLYLNEGTGMFIDATNPFGLGAPSLGSTSFGMSWFDFDNDGLLDLFIANGAVKRFESSNTPFPYRMPNQLFHQQDSGKLVDISRSSGSAFELLETSRGAAFGDVDLDGDIDIVVGNLNAPLRLLLNRTGQDQNWLMLHLVGSESNRDAIGAWVGVHRKEKPTLWRRVHSAESCYSASDRRLHFGLGDDDAITGIRVEWPSGIMEEWSDVAINRLVVLREGEGNRVAS